MLLALVRTSAMGSMVPGLRDQLKKVLGDPGLKQSFLRDGVLVIGPAGSADRWDPQDRQGATAERGVLLGHRPAGDRIRQSAERGQVSA